MRMLFFSVGIVVFFLFLLSSGRAFAARWKEALSASGTEIRVSGMVDPINRRSLRSGGGSASSARAPQLRVIRNSAARVLQSQRLI